MTNREARIILQIQGTLHWIGDIVYIPDLQCNGAFFQRDCCYSATQLRDIG